MNKRLLLSIFVIAILSSCAKPDVVFFVDSFYKSAVFKPAELGRVIDKNSAHFNKKVKIRFIKPFYTSMPDLTAQIGKEKAKTIMLTPLLGKDVSNYSKMYPGKYFIVTNMFYVPTIQNVSCFYSDRSEAYKKAAELFFLQQKAGKRSSAVFYTGSSTRLKEKNAFTDRFMELSGGLYELTAFDIMRTDENILVDDLVRKLDMEGFQYVMLSAASANSSVFRSLRETKEIQYITENFYQYESEMALLVDYTINPDYNTAFKEFFAQTPGKYKPVPLKSEMKKIDKTRVKIIAPPVDKKDEAGIKKGFFKKIFKNIFKKKTLPVSKPASVPESVPATGLTPKEAVQQIPSEIIPSGETPVQATEQLPATPNIPTEVKTGETAPASVSSPVPQGVDIVPVEVVPDAAESVESTLDNNVSTAADAS